MRTNNGVGFMVSPVVISMGVGYFGLQFSLGFPATVLLAHLAFGVALGYLAAWVSGEQASPTLAALRTVVSASPASPSTV